MKTAPHSTAQRAACTVFLVLFGLQTFPAAAQGQVGQNLPDMGSLADTALSREQEQESRST